MVYEIYLSHGCLYKYLCIDLIYTVVQKIYVLFAKLHISALTFHYSIALNLPRLMMMIGCVNRHTHTHTLSSWHTHLLPSLLFSKLPPLLFNDGVSLLLSSSWEAVELGETTAATRVFLPLFPWPLSSASELFLMAWSCASGTMSQPCGRCHTVCWLVEL